MLRQPRPRYRADRDTWIVQVRGKQHVLARGKANRAAADLAFHRLMADAGRPEAVREHLTLSDLVARYLADLRAHGGDDSNPRYRLKALTRRFGDVRADHLKPHHVTTVVAERSGPDCAKHGGRLPWARASQSTFRAWCKRLAAWAVEQGYLDADPLAKLAVGGFPRRKATLSPEQARAAVAAATPPFRDFLEVVFETGARPGEIAKLEAKDIDWQGGVAVLERHKTEAKVDAPRVLVLSARAQAICEEHARRCPTGPIFRNRTGTPWDHRVCGKRFRRIQKKLGLPPGTGGYSMRHAFVDDCFEAGLSSKVTATLVGHTNTKTIDQFYSRLHERRKFLKEELEKVRPKTVGSGNTD
jgi:integrase